MTAMMHNIRMVCLPIILDIHDSAPIAPISMVDDMLYPPIRKSNSVLPLYITSLISRPYFTKVCVILGSMDTVLEVERIWMVIISLTMTSSYMSSTSNNYSSTNTSWFSKSSSYS